MNLQNDTFRELEKICERLSGMFPAEKMKAIYDLQKRFEIISPEIIESFNYSQNILKTILPEIPQIMESSNILQKDLKMVSPEILQTMESLNRLQKISEMFSPYIIELQKFSPIINSTVLNVLNTINTTNIQFDLTAILPKINELMESCLIDEQLLKEKTELTEEEEAEIKETISEIFSDDLNWEQKIREICIKLKDKYPARIYILLGILGVILAITTNITSNLIYETIFKAKIKEPPTSNSKLITTLEEN